MGALFVANPSTDRPMFPISLKINARGLTYTLKNYLHPPINSINFTLTSKLLSYLLAILNFFKSFISNDLKRKERKVVYKGAAFGGRVRVGRAN